MNIVKRDGKVVPFEKEKIYKAIEKSMKFGSGSLNIPVALKIASEIEKVAEKSGKDLTVSDIEGMVFSKLIEKGEVNTARNYEGYRSIREHQRNTINTTDNNINELVSGTSVYWNEENSNKNPTLSTTERDYVAGEVSTDITKRFLLPPTIIQNHEEGIIHFHDADYYLQHMHNCDLVNLEDMLQNGTVISEIMIEKPHSFSTACNVATQIIAQVASSQYGGQSVTLSHLAPFVEVSRQKARREVREELASIGVEVEDEKVNQMAEMRVKLEIEKGVQTIQYQVITLMTTNGQAPFLTVFMYLNEVKDEQTKADLALIIEEVLKQRYQGVKNEKGVYITPAFPKLIYVTEEDNIYPGTKYYYLTELAAKCSCKRMVPDYISEKMMLQLKIDKNGNGNVYPCIN